MVRPPSRRSILRTGKFAAKTTATSSALAEALIPKTTQFADDFSFSSSSHGDDQSDDTGSGLLSVDLLSDFMSRDIMKTTMVILMVTGGMAASASAIVAVPSAIIIMMGSVCIGEQNR